MTGFQNSVYVTESYETRKPYKRVFCKRPKKVRSTGLDGGPIEQTLGEAA